MLRLFLLIFICGQAFAEVRPEIKKGVLDLSNWDFKKGSVELKGEWQFFWKKFIKNSSDIEGPSHFLKTNTSWSNLSKDYTRTGYGSFVVKVVGIKGISYIFIPFK